MAWYSVDLAGSPSMCTAAISRTNPSSSWMDVLAPSAGLRSRGEGEPHGRREQTDFNEAAIARRILSGAREHPRRTFLIMYDLHEADSQKR